MMNFRNFHGQKEKTMLNTWIIYKSSDDLVLSINVTIDNELSDFQFSWAFNENITKKRY